MRFWGINAGGGARGRRCARAALTAAVICVASTAHDARAASPPVAPYGQVAAVGQLDTGADYSEPDSTANLTEGDFVDPVGMTAVPDASSPGGEDIYVLDLVNPQAINGLVGGSTAPEDVQLEYRLQEIAIAPSTANGDDGGTEHVLGCTTFTLASSASAPDEHAVSLAVDGPESKVEVLVDDMPDYQGSTTGFSVAYEVDQWSTTLPSTSCPATAGLDPVVSSSTLVKKSPGLQGDIDGDSVTFAGTGTGAQLALGGSLYLNGPAAVGFARTSPFIETFSGGSVSATWKDAEAAANSLAKAGPINGKGSAPGWGIDQSSMLSLGSSAAGGFGDVLYSLSGNPDGTLNVTLGPQDDQYVAGASSSGTVADWEPIMATVSADLSTTSPVLPSSAASPVYGYPQGWKYGDGDPPYDAPPSGDDNSEVAATDVAEQDTADGGYDGSYYLPAGGTLDGGTLAPSVVALGGSASGLYAGYVADNIGAGVDTNLSPDGESLGSPAPWALPGSSTLTANLGVRIFTGCGTGSPCASGTPVAMIGNGGTGACSIPSGDYGFTQGPPESTIALAAGQNGTVYALTQPDLDGIAGGISPTHPESGAGVGDVLMEFEPGAGSGSDPGVACPGPSGSFSVTDESNPRATPDTGTGAVEVTAGSTLQFDGSAVDLQGGVPWTYTWDSDIGAADDQMPPPSTFGPDLNVDSSGNYTPLYERPTPTQDFVYTNVGESTAQLQLESDFGTETLTRQIDVVAPGPITADVTAAGGAVAGEPTTLSAAGTTVASPDNIVDYHWDFGNGTSDDTAGPTETWTFPSAGTYTVTLTAIDEVGRTQTATTQVSVAAPPPGPPAAPTTATTSTQVPHTAVRFSVSPKFRSVKSNAELSGRLSCPAGDRTCAGTIAVLTAGKVSVPGGKGKRQLSLGKGTFSVSAGHSTTVVVKLAKSAQTLISPLAPLRLTIIVVAHDSAGTHATERVALSLFPPRSSRPRQFG